MHTLLWLEVNWWFLKKCVLKYPSSSFSLFRCHIDMRLKQIITSAQLAWKVDFYFLFGITTRSELWWFLSALTSGRWNMTQVSLWIMMIFQRFVKQQSSGKWLRPFIRTNICNRLLILGIVWVLLPLVLFFLNYILFNFFLTRSSLQLSFFEKARAL